MVAVVLSVDVSVFVVVTTFVVVLGVFVEVVVGSACVLSGVAISSRHVEHWEHRIKVHFLTQDRPSSAHHDSHFAHSEHAPQSLFHWHFVSHG